MDRSPDSEGGAAGPTSIKELKPGMEGVTVRGRVLEASPPKVIQTKKGPRTISNAVVGDSSGRVEVTLWGEKAGTLEAGKAVEISGAWTTSFRGRVQLNVGKTSKITEIADGEAPQPSEVPEEFPEAPEEQPRRGGFGRRGFRPRRGGSE